MNHYWHIFTVSFKKSNRLNRATRIITINSIEQIPTIETIRAIPRERILKIVFEKSVQNQREKVGQSLKNELSGFQVGVHTIEPEINIAKLITDVEIEHHQDFFEQCAKDYRQLAEELLFLVINKLDLKLNTDFPMDMFNELKRDERQIGIVEDWRYHIHGFHCGFENNTTEQLIEVPLVFGLEFGDLDPYFFSKFIKSSPKYRPLPVAIFEDYADGVRINEKMISLGKFEKIESNIDNHYGTVVTDRQKIKVKTFQELKKISDKQNTQNEKTKISFRKLFGFEK